MNAFTLVVQIQVKPEYIDAFREATLTNARASRQEPGIRRFELLQQQDAPDRFLLVEEYREADAQLRHRETSHYAIWRDTVAPMMAVPRAALKYQSPEPS